MIGNLLLLNIVQSNLKDESLAYNNFVDRSEAIGRKTKNEMERKT